MSDYGLYVHVPFCHSNCTYCDFYRESYRDSAAEDYLAALEIELRSIPRSPPPRTIYVGGGTPSALKEDLLERLLEALSPFRGPGQEYTFEVNPRSATPAKIDLLGRAGVSRVSFGAQTFNARALQMLGRRHTAEDIPRVHEKLKGRIASISLDLIFALPGQSLDDWEFDLSEALRLSPDHLSVYSLIYEEGTPITEKVRKGELEAVPEELEREMFLLALDRLTGEGYQHYEVSSYCRPGHDAEHNQAYWLQRDYVGVGPGACSTLGSRRYTNLPDVQAYVRGCHETGSPPRREERLTERDKLNEFLLLRLRTAAGLCSREFRKRAGQDLRERSARKLEELAALGLLRVTADSVRLTREGFCVADRVISELMA